MNLIIVAPLTGSRSFHLRRPHLLLGLLLLLGLPFAGGIVAGHSLQRPVDPQQLFQEQSQVTQLQQQLAIQFSELKQLRGQSEERLNAMALRMGRMQAQMARLDAVGHQLVSTSHLDAGEFDFLAPPPVGGPESPLLSSPSLPLPDFMAQLDRLEWAIRDRSDKLDLLQNALRNQSWQAGSIPSGEPVAKGWISSDYGYRLDPFNGKPDFHQGLDLSAREGSPIRAVADGIVTESSDREGYGNLVELNHGNGYLTRYAHNRFNLVRVGDRIKKGETLAIVGTTGRSTGPHLHFEVVKEGITLNPAPFLTAARQEGSRDPELPLLITPVR